MTPITNYLQQFTPEQQKQAEPLYTLLKSLLPDVEEQISYGMAAFGNPKTILYFGVFNTHIGFFPTPEVVVHFEHELKHYQTTKSSIHLPFDQALDVQLIKEIVDYRLTQMTLSQKSQIQVHQRPRNVMPLAVAEQLKKANVMAQYEARPPYQRNDYLGWINQAKREATRQKRIEQMISELQAGNVYMKMAWHKKVKKS